MANRRTTSSYFEDQIQALGFVPTKLGNRLEGFARIKSCVPDVVGECLPISSHLRMLEECSWNEGQVLLVREESPRFILWEQFFFLESLELPRDLLQLRDYVDYGLEAQIQELFPHVNAIIGPGWRYLFPCVDMIRNLESSLLELAPPMAGNALNCRSDCLTELTSTLDEIKGHLRKKLPIPLVWAFPDGLPIGAKDNFYDSNADSWFLATIKEECEGSMSMVDLRPDEDGCCRMMQHDFNGGLRPVKFELKGITIHFSEVNGRFKSRRKLSKLKIRHLSDGYSAA